MTKIYRHTLFAVFILINLFGRAQTFLQENFDSSIPGTFTITDAGGATGDSWISGQQGGSNSLNGTNAAIVNSDANGNGTLLLETMTTPVLNTSGATLLFLDFDQYYRNFGTDSAIVEVFNGAVWVPVLSQNGSDVGAFNNPDQQHIDITAHKNAAMQVRFRYNDNNNWAWYWLVDNLHIYEGQCPRPDPTFAFNVTDSSATLDWIENGTATSWEVEWGLSGFAQGSGTSFVTNTKPDTLFGLTANTSYDFYVRAICGPADTSIWSILENFTTVATCAMPDTLSLDTLTTTSADLDWVEMGSATTWQIEWDSASFALGTGNLVTTSTKPFQITGLSPNGLYGYYVRAICGPADTSVWSPISLFVTPASCPDPDTLTVSNIDATSVHLGWAETGSATTWQIEWDTVGFVPGNGNFLITTTNPHVLSGLTPNQSYAFYVRSICAPGDTSSWSAVKTFVATSCPTPSGLQVSNILNTSVILSWTENGSATNWEVEWGAAGFTPGSGNSVTTISNPGLLENLMSGTDYDFYVRSICGVGDTSLLAGPVNFETDTACRPPSNKSVTNITATSVDLSWNENGSATSWEIEWDTTGFVKGTGNTIVTSSNPYNLTGLTPGVTYDFNVRAICGSDSSIFTPPPTTFTPLGCPPPMLLSANSITETSADLEWLESGSATSWQIQWDTVSAGFGQPTATYAITSSNPYSLTGLSSGAHYTYYVRSICGVGDTSTWSGPLTFILESCPIPDNKTVTELFSTSANLHWDENGLATSWQIEWDTVGFTQGTGNLVTTSTNPHNLTGLTPDTRYEFYVRSICASGDTSAWDGSPTIFWTPETDSANFPPLSPVTIEEDSVVTLCYTALNGMDADSILICGNGGNYGTSSIVSNCIVYDPDTNYIGNDTICFITCKNGTCDSNWVHIVVTPVRDTISISTPEDIDFIICDTTLNSVSADSVLLCGDGNHGTTTITGNCFTFDPDSNFVGQDTTCYVVCHDGFCDTTIITWSITPVTDTITLTTLEDINFIICDTTLNNGLNADSVQICGEGNHGTTTIAGNCFTFDPDSNFIGLDTTCYTVCHDGFCDTTIITWSITPVIDTLDITLLEDVNFNICDTVLNNGLNADSVVLCQDGGYGTTTIAGNCFTFDPDSNFIGLDTACYAVCHDGFCDTTIITFTFNPIMDTIGISIPEDNDFTICDTSLNFVSADSVQICGDGNNGTTTIASNCFTFDPDSNYIGLDTTCYLVCHDGFCDTTIITWNITPVTDTITLTTPEEINFTICDTTLNNGLDADSVQICGDGNHGTTTIAGNCFTFDPDSNFIGLDTTCYMVCHDGFCDTTIITWNITPIMDTITLTTPEDIDFTICDTTLNNGLDADSVLLCGDGNHGTTSIAGNCFTFDPDSNFIGLDTTCYTVCHDGFCDTTIITWNITPIMDTITLTTPEDINFTICDTTLNNGLNADSVLLCGDGNLGTTTIAGNCFTFDPDSNFIGLDTTCYTVCHDGFCDTTIITWSITPVIDTLDISLLEDTNFNICDTVLNNGLNADSVVLCQDGGYGTTTIVGNCFTFDPDSNFIGLDTACYAVCHDGFCDTTIITFTFNPVMDTISISTPEDNDYTICDTTLNDGLKADSVLLCGDGNHGRTSVTGNCFTFDPDSNYVGLDTTCYVVCHDGLCDTTIVTWSIIPVTDTITLSTPEDIDFTTCDTTLNNGLNADSVQICGDGNHGTTTLLGNCFTFDPDSNYIGLDTTCYTVCHDGFCDTTIIAWSVTPVIDTISISTLENINFILCDTALNNGLNADSVQICGDGNHGTTTIAGNCLTFDLDSNFIGLDTTCYAVCHDGFCDTTFVAIVVNPVLDTISTTIPENSSLTICDVTLNVASDSILICGGGTNGTTIIVGNCFTYTPNNNFTGFDTTCFIVCNDGLCDTTFVSIFVDPIPEIHCMDTTIYLDENGLTSLDTSYVLNQIIDNNLDSVWMASSGSFDCLDTGIVAITLFAQDSLGSLDSCIALVNIVDTIRPIVDCPSPQFVQVSIPTCEFEVLDYSSLVTTSDNCTSVGNISYEQTPMIGDSIDADDRTQVFTINVTDEHGNTNTCSFDVEFDCTIEVYFYEGFTPNGDGTNDTWVIEGIEKFPNAKLRILNRWGSIVYLSENGYNNNWDGKSTEGLTFNGDELPSGTYFYILELGNETDDSFKGYLYLKR